MNDKLDRCLEKCQVLRIDREKQFTDFYAFEPEDDVAAAKLGHGTYGTAYRVRRKGSASDLRCVKIIPKATLTSSVISLRHLAAEIACMMRLPVHPHVNHGDEVLYDDENVYLVAELIAGQRPSLRTRMFSLCQKLNPCRIFDVDTFRTNELVSTGCPLTSSQEDKAFEDFRQTFIGAESFMERPWSGELYDLIESGRGVGEVTTKVIIKQCLEALAHLHAYRLVHRDVKCENFVIARDVTSEIVGGNVDDENLVVKITERFRVVLIDFGLCKLMVPSCNPSDDETPGLHLYEEAWATTSSGSGGNHQRSVQSDFLVDVTPLISTEIYEACESVEGRAGIAGPHSRWISSKSQLPKLDIWGVGAVMYCLLNGYPRFYFKDHVEPTVLLTHIAAPLTYNPFVKISDGAKLLIEKMFQQDPRKRPSAEQLLQEPYFEGVTDTVVTLLDKQGPLGAENTPTQSSEMEMQHTPSLNAALRVIEEGADEADSPPINAVSE